MPLHDKTIRIFLIFLLGGAGTLYAQPAALSLEQCYELLRTQHPTAQNLPLLEVSHRLQMQNLNRQYLPQAQLNAQATWQSDVTALPIEVPLPGFNIPTISQDQYRATLELRQTLWDGGVNARQKDIQTAATQVARQSVEVELHNLKNQVNTLYFSILLADEQQGLNDVLQENLQMRIQRMEAAVTNGTATRANLYSLQAELLKAEQQAISIQANRRSAVASLGLLLQQELNENITFIAPSVNNGITNTEIQRPELTLFQYQQQLLAAQSDLIPAINLPKFSAFATGGYGRPGLNFLDNDFTPYAIIGVGMSWNVSNLYTGKQRNDQQLLSIQQQQVNVQQQAFLLQTNTQIQQLQNEITRLQASLNKAEQQIALREAIRQTAEAQLDNGIITSADYLVELNAENQSRLDRAVLKLQLLLAKANYEVIIGR
mgnify:FL=1